MVLLEPLELWRELLIHAKAWGAKSALACSLTSPWERGFSKLGLIEHRRNWIITVDVPFTGHHSASFAGILETNSADLEAMLHCLNETCAFCFNLIKCDQVSGWCLHWRFTNRLHLLNLGGLESSLYLGFCCIQFSGVIFMFLFMFWNVLRCDYIQNTVVSKSFRSKRLSNSFESLVWSHKQRLTLFIRN